MSKSREKGKMSKAGQRMADSVTDEAVSSTSRASLLDPYSMYLPMLSKHKVTDSTMFGAHTEDSHALKIAPLFTSSVHEKSLQLFRFGAAQQQQEPYPQYGLLGLMDKEPTDGTPTSFSTNKPQDKLVFTNTSEPWSTFICGSQGSGKSHTLSCLLENNLLRDPRIGTLRTPLTGMSFHYDKFSNFNSGQICEAAYLCSTGIRVKVLVAPTSETRMRSQYLNLPGLPPGCPKPEVLPLYFSQDQLTVDVMMTLMAVHDTGVSAPLYICAIRQLLRDIAMLNQDKPGFDYLDFRQRLACLSLTEGQNAPLELRLSLLQSVLLETKQSQKARDAYKRIWTFEPGTLTIVDLSDQFVNESDACALFSICLKLFMDGWQKNPRIIALDEAHKFLSETSEAHKLTTDLVAIIRQQRHLSSRVIIATQEPTVSGELLDLCNVSIVHRFNSPEWFKTLRKHLAGASNDSADGLFRKIVKLSTGEALVFCPTAVLSMESSRPQPLQDNYAKVTVRDRISADGGQSILPSHRFTSTATQPQAPVIKFERFSGENVPAPGSLARAKYKAQHTGASNATTSTNSKSITPVAQAVVNGAPLSRVSSNSSTGQKRQRLAIDGASDSDEVVHERPPSAQPSLASPQIPDPIAIPANAVHGKKNHPVLESTLRKYMYNAINRMLGQNLVKDPSGYISRLLADITSFIGLPGRYLLDHALCEGCRESNATEMLKGMIKGYYDEKMVPTEERGNIKWLM